MNINNKQKQNKNLVKLLSYTHKTTPACVVKARKFVDTEKKQKDLIAYVQQDGIMWRQCVWQWRIICVWCTRTLQYSNWVIRGFRESENTKDIEGTEDIDGTNDTGGAKNTEGT